MYNVKLTQKQEAFCLAYIETGNASEAYRRVYKTSGKESTVNREAKALLDNPKITARIAELRAPVVEKAKVTLESHIRDLEYIRNRAVKEGKYGPAVQAEIARGKASGLYTDNINVTVSIADEIEKARQRVRAGRENTGD